MKVRTETFFEILLYNYTGEYDSKFRVAQLVKEWASKIDRELLPYFVEDLRLLAEDWQNAEAWKMYEYDLKEYNLNIDILKLRLDANQISKEEYDNEMTAFTREPQPNSYYAMLPPQIIWAMEIWQDFVHTSAPYEQQPNNPTPIEINLHSLPPELDTPEARKYFARAIEHKYMERTDTGAKWKDQLVRLAYVCGKIYEQPRPISALQKFFGVTKLDASITQAGYEPKRSDVKKWRDEIDKNIFYD